jgi:peptide methionine sulfoxide reductase MsrB
MQKRNHGTCDEPVQNDLKWGCDNNTADRICCFNRHYAEYSGYAFTPKITWRKELAEKAQKDGPKAITTYYDSVTGKSLFRAPVGRSLGDFIVESENHGWPSFRDEEVDWENVRCLKNGEVVSVDGTHLGHNLPDEKGNRYCINLVSIAG